MVYKRPICKSFYYFPCDVAYIANVRFIHQHCHIPVAHKGNIVTFHYFSAPARTFISGGSRRSSALTVGTVAAATACGSAFGYYLHTRTQSTLGTAHVLEAASKAPKEQPSVSIGSGRCVCFRVGYC